jgi:AraC-like DNA-binding protein
MWIGLLLGVILFLCALIIVLFRRYRKAASILEAQQNESVAHPDPFISRLEQYIEDNLTTVSVDSLSEFTGLSTRGLYRVLEASYGLKPGDLIRNMKLKKIRSLLEENPTIDKETLANNVGYSEYHLARILEKEGKLR